MYRDTLTWRIMVLISQYMQILNPSIVHLKQIQCSMSVIDLNYKVKTKSSLTKESNDMEKKRKNRQNERKTK